MLTARTRLILLFIAMATLCMLTSGCSRLEPATNFEVTLFSGKDFKLSDQTGHSAVVLNFWYPSCPPCREEMPNFEKASQQYQGDGVRFLGLFVPNGFDSEQDARDFVKELGLTFDFATDSQALVAKSYQVEFFPTTYFIDANGRVFKTQVSNLDLDTITGIIDHMDRG